jgi:hypothetical protein
VKCQTSLEHRNIDVVSSEDDILEDGDYNGIIRTYNDDDHKESEGTRVTKTGYRPTVG